MARIGMLLLLAGVLVSCGQAEQVSTPSIVGGEKVKESDPISRYTVSLLNPGNDFFCSGVVYDQRHILTAAHCVLSLKPGAVVGFGIEADTSKLDRAHVIAVSDSIAHAGFPRDFADREVAGKYFKEAATIDDIGVIRLSEDVPESYLPDYAIAGSKTTYKRGTPIVLAGFGINGDKEEVAIQDKESGNVLFIEQFAETSGTLRLVRSKMEAESDRNELFFIRYRALKIFSNVLTLDRGGACPGDSGGPSFVELKDATTESTVKKLMLTGIASRADCNGFSIYTDVRGYRSWIDDVALPSFHKEVSL